jgi:hypothetical protein
VRAQRLEVTDRLGVLQRAERVAAPGDLDVGIAVGDQRQEAPDRRPALVQLAGRVQEARSVAERRRELCVLHQRRPQRRDLSSNSTDGVTYPITAI